jgi:putative glutamine amidotransferase
MSKVRLDRPAVRPAAASAVAKPIAAPAQQQKAPLLEQPRGTSVGGAVAVAGEQLPPSRSARMHYVAVEGAGVDVMVPATGGSPEESFQKWAKALQHEDVFGDQRPFVDELQHVKLSPGVGAADDRPRIGIMLHHANAVAHERHDVKTFVEEIEKAGCRAVLIPPMADIALPDDPVARQQALAGMVGQLDGLIAPGGPDIHPRLYHEAIRGAARDTLNYPRDAFEAQLLSVARDESLFTLGICRGHQLLNVVGGAHLIQDMVAAGQVSYSHDMRDYDESVSQIEHAPTAHGPEDHVVEARGELREIIGVDRVATNSVHHESVAKAASDSEVVGLVHDGGTGQDVIEATRKWNMLSVQFHPELRPDEPESKAIFGTLKRAWAFFFADQLRREGVKPTTEAIAERLTQAKVELSEADRHWLATELGHHL